MVSPHHNVTGAEGFAQDLDALLRLSLSTHEDVEGRIIGLGPAVDGDVALRQNGNARHATIGREVMQMDVQQGCARYLHAPLERALDVLDIIQTTGTEQVHQKVGAGIAQPVALDEKVLPVVMRNLRIVFVRHLRSNTTIFLLGGA